VLLLSVYCPSRSWVDKPLCQYYDGSCMVFHGVACVMRCFQCSTPWHICRPADLRLTMLLLRLCRSLHGKATRQIADAGGSNSHSHRMITAVSPSQQ
jgi:hypothetical protein